MLASMGRFRMGIRGACRGRGWMKGIFGGFFLTGLRGIGRGIIGRLGGRLGGFWGRVRSSLSLGCCYRRLIEY